MDQHPSTLPLISPAPLLFHPQASDLDMDQLSEALTSHRTVQDGGSFRERTVFLFGSETAATDLYFEIAAQIRKLENGLDEDNDPLASSQGRATPAAAVGRGVAGGPMRASDRWADAREMLKEVELEQYIPQFEEEEMTSLALLEVRARRAARAGKRIGRGGGLTGPLAR